MSKVIHIISTWLCGKKSIIQPASQCQGLLKNISLLAKLVGWILLCLVTVKYRKNIKEDSYKYCNPGPFTRIILLNNKVQSY